MLNYTSSLACMVLESFTIYAHSNCHSRYHSINALASFFLQTHTSNRATAFADSNKLSLVIWCFPFSFVLVLTLLCACCVYCYLSSTHTHVKCILEMVGANTGNAENAHRKSLSVIRFVASMRYFSKTPSSIFLHLGSFFLSMRIGWCCSQSGRKAKRTISHQVHIFSISLYFLSIFTRYKKANTYQLPFDHMIYAEVKRDTKTLKLFEVQQFR